MASPARQVLVDFLAPLHLLRYCRFGSGLPVRLFYLECRQPTRALVHALSAVLCALHLLTGRRLRPPLPMVVPDDEGRVPDYANVQASSFVLTTELIDRHFRGSIERQAGVARLLDDDGRQSYQSRMLGARLRPIVLAVLALRALGVELEWFGCAILTCRCRWRPAWPKSGRSLSGGRREGRPRLRLRPCFWPCGGCVPALRPIGASSQCGTRCAVPSISSMNSSIPWFGREPRRRPLMSWARRIRRAFSFTCARIRKRGWDTGARFGRLRRPTSFFSPMQRFLHRAPVPSMAGGCGVWPASPWQAGYRDRVSWRRPGRCENSLP